MDVKIEEIQRLEYAPQKCSSQ